MKSRLPPTRDSGRIQQKASDPLVSAWVAASAGTGKTKVLTDRFLRLLLAGYPASRILCLTFTKAAAAEMANRINAILAEWVVAEDEKLLKSLNDLTGRILNIDEEQDAALLVTARTLFAALLETPGGARIQTIHGFCQSLLGRFPLEAGISPHFETLDDREAIAIQQAVRESISTRVGLDASSDNPLHQAWQFLASCLDEEQLGSILGTVLGKRADFEGAFDAHGSLAHLTTAINAVLGLDDNRSAEQFLLNACSDENFDVVGLRVCANALIEDTKNKTSPEKGCVIAAFLATPDPSDRASTFDVYRDVFLTKEHTVRSRLCTKAVAKACPDAERVLSTEAERVYEIGNRLKAYRIADATRSLVCLIESLLTEYRDRKAALGRLDYDDLILATNRLLDSSDAAAWVLYKLDGGLDHLLIDEAQDTSPQQWAIARKLADAFFADQANWTGELPRTVFAVGDRKQSIYGFQGADPKVFDDMRGHFHDQVKAIGGRFETLPLNLSYRSSRPVLTAVNAVFTETVARAGVVQEGEDITHVAFRDMDAGLVEVWPTIPATATDELPAWKPPVESVSRESAQVRLARLLAARIARMTDGSEILPSQARPIHAGDIMILLRSRSGFERDLVSALKSVAVPVSGVDRLMLSGQIVIQDLVALGRVMLLPEDDLSLAALLKSPLFGITEDELYELSVSRGRGVRLWHRLSTYRNTDSALGRSYATLEQLRRRAARLTPYALFAQVLDGAMNGRRLLLARLGEEAEDPINEFLDLTQAFERTNTPSLQAFLSWFEKSETEIKRDLDQRDPKAVRIMTVHGSKGLQAPIVFLPDTTTVPNRSPEILWTRDQRGNPVPLWCPRADDRNDFVSGLVDAAKMGQEQEYRRLMYVAMTRAADRLYVCGWDRRRTSERDSESSWHALISQAMRPIADEVEAPYLSCTGLENPVILRFEQAQSRLVKTAEKQPKTASIAIPEWLETPAPVLPYPSRPITPSKLFDEAPPVRSPADKQSGNARRFQRGTLIHRLLQSLPDLPDSLRKQMAEKLLTRRTWDLSASEVTQITDEVLSVLNNPNYASLFGAGSRAEVPIIGKIGSHTVSGQVDRLAVQDNEVMIVDYKTNRPPPASPEFVDPLYLRQMTAYRAVLEDVFPDRRIRCLILWTDGPRLMELPDTLLPVHSLL